MAGTGTIPRARSGVPVRVLHAELIRGNGEPKAAQSHHRLTIGSAAGNDIVIADPAVSRFHLELSRRGPRILVSDLESTNGTEVGPALLRGTSALVGAGTVLRIGDSQLRVNDGEVVLEDLGPRQLSGFVGSSTAVRQLLATIERLASSEVPVLVHGESGTGKELVAQAIHENSPRRDGPFVTVDCAALSPTLFASELFGHERGAFTGAERRRIGAFESAQGGTVFLDEIGELPATLQSSLLGVLERRQLRRLGGNEVVEVDTRLIAATHRDLRSEVNAGAFRLDLYYRLAAVSLYIPPLRERKEDIEPLIEHFLTEQDALHRMSELFPESSLERLQRQRWPGNARELRNVVMGTLALGLRPEEQDLPPFTNPEPGELFDGALQMSFRKAKERAIEGFERAYLQALLEAAEGNMRRAARMADMDRTYMMKLMRRHGMR